MRVVARMLDIRNENARQRCAVGPRTASPGVAEESVLRCPRDGSTHDGSHLRGRLYLDSSQRIFAVGRIECKVF